ncbi:MAG: cytochrome c [Proteobacteria bacterium]|nr:cytochrome c [Pseudomonadota bacterium]
MRRLYYEEPPLIPARCSRENKGSLRIRFTGFAVAIALLLVATGCTSAAEPADSGGSSSKDEAGQSAQTGSSAGDIERGKALFRQQCVACHTVASIPEARAEVGPELTTIASQAQIAGMIENTPENLMRWIGAPEGVKPGTQMPNLGLKPEQVADLVAFLQTLK